MIVSRHCLACMYSRVSIARLCTFTVVVYKNTNKVLLLYTSKDVGNVTCTQTVPIMLLLIYVFVDYI